jgi:hypothetical protein
MIKMTNSDKSKYSMVDRILASRPAALGSIHGMPKIISEFLDVAIKRKLHRLSNLSSTM